MVPKLFVLMVAASALEGVFGLPDKQLVNGTQSKANLGLGKAQRGRRLDKLACKIFHGVCQSLDKTCDGVLEEGPDWCLHSRHFGCCIPQTDTLGCSLNGRVYRDGAIAEEGCTRLICLNSEWEFFDLNKICGYACIYGTTIMPFVPHPPLGNEYNMTGDTGVYSLSQYGFTSDPRFGVDIYMVDGLIECILIYCEGVKVEICCSIEGSYPWVWVNGERLYIPPFGQVDIIWYPGPVYMIFESSSIYIICPEFTVCVNWVPDFDPWLFGVYLYVSQSLYGELYGLFGVWVPPPPPPYPDHGIMQGGGETDNLHDFITSWQLPHSRSRISHRRKNPSSDHTGQVTVRPIIERSMSDIEKLCEETNKDPCTILSQEECEKIIDYCMSHMSNVSKPGHGGLIDSSE